jgi:hypothetical protein
MQGMTFRGNGEPSEIEDFVAKDRNYRCLRGGKAVKYLLDFASPPDI